MTKYLLKRIGLAFLTLGVILFISYCLVRLAPGDPTKSSILGGTAEGLSASKNELAKNISLIKKLYLDKPVPVGFLLWLKNIILHFDFGDSASVDKGRPVIDLILERLPVTLKLNIWAILVTYLLAIPIGIYGGVKPYSNFDKISAFILFFLYSLPSFWFALVLQATLCEGGWFPIFPLRGLSAGNTWGVSSWEAFFNTAKHYILPVFCLSYAGFAGLSRYARNGILEVINQDFIRTARAKGVPERDVILKHTLKNAMIILITLFAGLIPGLVSGSIIIEYVFNIPGMGLLSMYALSSRDIPLLMALFAFGGILTLIGILVADLLYVLVDPRISFEKQK